MNVSLDECIGHQFVVAIEHIIDGAPLLREELLNNVPDQGDFGVVDDRANKNR